MAKRQNEGGLSRPLSAFAARKATMNPVGQVDKRQSVAEQTSQVSVPHYNGHPPPAKKQKTTVEHETSITPSSPSASTIELSTTLQRNQDADIESTPRRNLIEAVKPGNSADDIQENTHDDSENEQIRPVYESDYECDE